MRDEKGDRSDDSAVRKKGWEDDGGGVVACEGIIATRVADGYRPLTVEYSLLRL